MSHRSRLDAHFVKGAWFERQAPTKGGGTQSCFVEIVLFRGEFVAYTRHLRRVSGVFGQKMFHVEHRDQILLSLETKGYEPCERPDMSETSDEQPHG